MFLRLYKVASGNTFSQLVYEIKFQNFVISISWDTISLQPVYSLLLQMQEMMQIHALLNITHQPGCSLPLLKMQEMMQLHALLNITHQPVYSLLLKMQKMIQLHALLNTTHQWCKMQERTYILPYKFFSEVGAIITRSPIAIIYLHLKS